ncbi:MAG: twin-arginine translocation signal domain-containing protein, partial [Thermoanaerobaculia bacterium]
MDLTRRDFLKAGAI